MAEQFTAGQFFLQGGTIFNDHRIGRHRPIADESAWRQHPCRPRLTGEQDRYFRRSHLVDQKLDIADT